MNLLQALQLQEKNSGASTSKDWWSNNTSDGEIISYNPANGQAIACVYRASEKDLLSRGQLVFGHQRSRILRHSGGQHRDAPTGAVARLQRRGCRV